MLQDNHQEEIHYLTFMLGVEIKKILKFKTLNNGYLYGKRQKKNVFLGNMPLNILYQRIRIIKETYLI